ncbi:hypothetical protein ETD83_38685 [Actinomadura soli]|uniref:Uncharacterized protein n=1 Tax=Actinomadura soli TaxID=2508997 RepID=A0A5C4J2Q2_9ACTN|nr:hypothetical protein [Actinomadura soli]TMQ89723.1 hypothetical protein ETD83_38685 [Actinomadura soli]
MRFGPRDRPSPEPEDPGDAAPPPRPGPYPEDVRVAGANPAGAGPAPEDDQPASDWVPVQPQAEVPLEPGFAPPPDPPGAEPQPDWGTPTPADTSWTTHEPAGPSWTSQPPPPPPGTEPEIPPARGRHEAAGESSQETPPVWTPHESSSGSEPLSGGTPPGEPSPETPPTWGRHEFPGETAGRHERITDEPFLPGKGLATEPPPMTPPDVTAPDPHWAAVPEPRWGEAQETAASPGPMADPARRKALADAFVAEFVNSTTWRATLAVLEGAFPGLGMAARLSRQTDELWRTMDAVDRKASAKLGVPVWLDDAGMVFDLSAHLPSVRVPMGAPAGPPRASKPYAGAFVIDTLDPLRYHRAVGGPRAPRDLPGQGAPVPSTVEDDDSGVVIVANLTSAGVRVLDSAGLWRYADQVVTGTLHEAARPETRDLTRRALWALRRVVVVDPDLGLGLCLQIDAARVPRCLLAFGVDRKEGAPRFVRP